MDTEVYNIAFVALTILLGDEIGNCSRGVNILSNTVYILSRALGPLCDNYKFVVDDH